MCDGLGDAFKGMDPGRAIGNLLANLDKTVGKEIPGGWTTVAGLAAAVATAGAASGFLAEEAAIEGTEIAGDGTITTNFTDGSSAIVDPSGATTYITPDNSIAGMTEVPGGVPVEAPPVGADTVVHAPDFPTPGAESVPSPTSTPGADSVLNAPNVNVNLTPPGVTSPGSILPPLEGSGAIPGGAATTIGGGGLTGALPAGTVVGDGTLGTTLGQTYMATDAGGFALDALGNAIPASSVGIGGFAPSTGLDALDALSKAKKVADITKSLTGSSSVSKVKTPFTTGMLPTAGLGSSVPLNTDTSSNTYESPKATFVHGQQIAVPGMTGSEIAPTAPQMQTQAVTPLDLQLIQQAAGGGIIHMAGGGDLPMQEVRMRGKQFGHYQPRTGLSLVPHFAPGGEIEGHNPTFFSPGGLASMENTYVKGEGDGTSDSVAAMLADGEFVIPADVVSKLGNGSSDAGAKVLDNFLITIRDHAQKHDPKDLPPKSKGALAYLLDANKRVRA